MKGESAKREAAVRAGRYGRCYGMVALLVLLLFGSGPGKAGETRDRLVPILQAVLEAAVADSAVPGALMHAGAPKLGLNWSGAAGRADRSSGAPLTPGHAVRLASNTKTYTAAAALRLWEEGRLDLDAGLDGLLPAEFLELLRQGGYDPGAITPRHLLTHTAGLFDYATADAFLEQVLAEPGRRWTRLEQVRGAMEWGRPYGKPGAVFHYSDTGYVLLGLLIERQTGTGLAAALRSLLDFEGLNLRATWLETLEEAPIGVLRAYQYYGDLDIFAFDPSFDLYGGGGLVATMGDLATFMRALFSGRVFKRPETLAAMLGPVPVDGAPGMHEYRMGVSATQIAGYRAYVHQGFWGTAAAYFPDLDLSLAVSVNQGDTDRLWPLLEAAARAVGPATLPGSF